MPSHKLSAKPQPDRPNPSTPPESVQGRRSEGGPTGEASWVLRSPAATAEFGMQVARCLQGGETLALIGDLGAGKTHLVRGLAVGLGASADTVASPTFVFIHEYRGRLPLAHIDLYRIETEGELDHLGWDDYLDGRWVVAVEWADKAGARLPADRLELHVSHRTARTRTVTCKAWGPTAGALLQRLSAPPPSGRRVTPSS